MIEFTPYSALAGGVLIGLAATILLKLNGRIAGVSGILNGALSFQPDERLWRALFVAGLIVGGLIYQVISSEPLITREGFPAARLVIAGILVGFGTRLGSGCTSGHRAPFAAIDCRDRDIRLGRHADRELGLPGPR